MELKELADELREGHAVQHLDDRIVDVGPKRKDKSTMADFELARRASTCKDCMRSAPNDHIGKAVEKADSRQSFLDLIRDDVEHAEDCMAGME